AVLDRLTPEAPAPVGLDVREYIETEIKYEGYLDRQARSVRQLSEAHKVRLPIDLDYTRIPQLSNEAREKLHRFKPVDLGQAARIPGLTPADISVLQVLMARQQRMSEEAAKTPPADE